MAEIDGKVGGGNSVQGVLDKLSTEMKGDYQLRPLLEVDFERILTALKCLLQLV
jgi:hypothetical protein